MPELRTDWLTGRTVIVAEERAGRPNDFGEVALTPGGSAAQSSGTHACPFCPGQEHRTPASLIELPDGEGHWRLRVVPNRFPAVTLPEELARDAVRRDSAETGPANGAHEVIIECARHVDRTGALSVDELQDVLEMYAARLRHWRDGGRLRYGLVFKNQGHRAGASLAHLHSQLIALSAVPPTVEAEVLRAADGYARVGVCPYCRLMEQERSVGERTVVDRDGYYAYCPPASWQPFETWLLPSDHQPSFEKMAETEGLGRLAGVLHLLVSRIEAIVPEASYNLVLRTAPWVGGIDRWCHWRIELLPRAAAFAGFELATGIHINALSPEDAARHLRNG